MNKIYKVVWSKAKHCYVVTSELAKRQTKGCGARSLRMATVSLGVAASLLCAGAVLPIFGESMAEAKTTTVIKDNKKIITTVNYATKYNFQATEKSVTVGETEIAEYDITAFGNVVEALKYQTNDNVTFEVVEGNLIEVHNVTCYWAGSYKDGSYATVLSEHPLTPNTGDAEGDNEIINSEGAKSDVDGYSLTITGGTLQEVAGGLSNGGNVSNNTININGGTINKAAYGGYSKEGNVSSNSATITNGTITNTVYGGYSGVSGNVENNNVTINGGTIGDLDNGSGAVYGAYTYNGLASNNTITINSGSTVRCPTAGSSYNGKVEENTLNINGGTIVGMAFGGVGNGTYVKSNTVNIKNDATVNATVYGGMVWGDSASDPTDVTGNTVNISDTANVNENVYGGYTYYGKVSNNTVNLNGGTVYKVYGGYTTGGAAETNHVVMNGGVVGITTSGGRTVFSGGKLNGAYSYNSSGNSGNVTGNTVTIDKGTVMADIYGGNTEAKNNKSGDAIKNIVTINGGTLASDIYGGYSRAEGNLSGKVDGNEVIIAGGVLNKAKVEINGSNVETQGVRFIYGGYTYGNNGPSESTIAYKNAVTISGGTFNNSTEVTGGYSNLYNAELNTVNITKDFTSTVGDVTGGISVYDTAKENTVTIAGGIVSNVYGGSGTVAEKNSVNITGGTVSGKVYGGHTDFGTAGGDTANDGNKVTISDNATVSGTVYGGYSEKGAATGNTVSIEGGTVNANVWGGQGASSSGNKITMSGGIFSGLLMIGGIGTSGSGDGNTVTISGGTFSDSNYNSTVQGGAGKPGSLNNTVNLTSTVTGLENVGLFGGGDSDNYSGNELHVGGTKDGTVTGVWQGKTGDTVNNKVKTVARFDKVVLHSVKWDTKVAALEATTVEKVKTLDIKDLKFDKTPANGESMALLKSGSNLSAITLTYEGGANKTITPAGIIVKDGSGEQTESTGVNGVKLTTKGGSEKVSLPDVNTILYSFEAGKVKGITFGTFDLSKEARDLSGSVFEEGNTVDAADLSFADTASILKKNDSVTLVSNASGMATAVANNTGKTIAIKDYEDAQKIKYTATATGDVTSDGTAVKYTVSSVTLNSVDLGGWAGTTAAVPESWTAGDKSVTVNNADAITVTPTATQAILTAGSGMFADVNVAKEVAFDPVAQNGVTLSGTQTNVIKTTQTNVANDTIMYEIGKKKDVKSVVIATVAWDGDALDGSSEDYNYAGASVDHSGFAVSNPEKVEADTAMTLLKANDTLQNMAAETKQASYSYTPVAGVTVEGNITGTLKSSGGAVTYTPTANQASKLTFGSVEWKDSRALMTRPANVVFDGAKVVTTNIKFTNIDSQVADQTMTLVHKFDGTPSAIEGDHYMVGSGRMGEGAAEMNGNDLIFRTKTGTAPTEATHETVMAMEAGTAVVAAGREYVDSAVEGLGLVSNMAPDGTSTFASMGGGVGRYKTGSHVDTHTWSAVVAVGSKREHKKGSLEWGVFAEYGRGNYTLHDDNGGRGDGDTHYAGGGLLAKWTNKHDVYAEASVRLGRMSDSASNMLTDRLGNSYGYDVHANYVGGHVGFGKIYKVQKTKDLDVYGKFFYTRRNGVDFDAGGNHYSLDSVNSSLLRVGARYGSNDRKWNWYGGLAYEYEFGGESKGTVDGLAIRSASIKGASVRGEIGMRMEATKTNPWKVDIGIFGYGGKHRGFGGSVNVAYMF